MDEDPIIVGFFTFLAVSAIVLIITIISGVSNQRVFGHYSEFRLKNPIYCSDCGKKHLKIRSRIYSEKPLYESGNYVGIKETVIKEETLQCESHEDKVYILIKDGIYDTAYSSFQEAEKKAKTEDIKFIDWQNQ